MDAKTAICFLYFILCVLEITNPVHAKKCENHLTGFLGMFNSPSYPENYESNVKCHWLITSSKGTKIQLRFTDFALEEDELCKFDYLEVFDGESSSAPFLGRFCGKSVRDLIVSTDNSMYLRFSSDASDVYRGFEAAWLAVDQRFVSPSRNIAKRQNNGECGNTVLTASSGSLTTPNYGQGKTYPSKQKCKWTIKTDADHQVNLRFETFSLEPHSECRYDYVMIKGSKVDEKDRFCGKVSPNGEKSKTEIKSNENEVVIEFISDGSTQKNGFLVKWWTTRRTSIRPSECGGELTGETGTITSPLYPKSSAKQIICAWKIVVPEGGRIKLEFIDLNIQNHLRCSTGYVQVIDKIKTGKERLGVFCGHLVPSPIKSSQNVMEVGYLSDKNSTTRGFRAKWTTFYQTDEAGKIEDKDTPCNSVLREENGYITHTKSKSCKWTIELPSNKRAVLSLVSVNLVDDPFCKDDVLVAKDSQSSSPLFKTCGDLKPRPVMSFTNQITVEHLVQRESISASEFKLRWESTDSDLNNNLFDTGSCLTSSMQDIKFAMDGKNIKELQPDHIPWMVQLHSSIHCAGAILSPEWVVSAAHCFSKMPMVSSWMVRAGDPNLFQNDGTEQISKIREIFFHPKFITTKLNYDIVLIRLKDKLTFNSKVRSICLPKEDTKLKENQECSVSGWGTSKYLGKPREKLFQVFPRIVDHDRCNSNAMYKGKITSNMICAGQGIYDSCQGDGGSPLICVENGRYFAAGLASWGNGCAAGKHGVYTDLRKQVAWIKSVMARNKS